MREIGFLGLLGMDYHLFMDDFLLDFIDDWIIQKSNNRIKIIKKLL
jgi:hypothetical protein